MRQFTKKILLFFLMISGFCYVVSQKPEVLESLFKVGAYKHQAGLDLKELGALTAVCQALLNLSETVTRN